VTPQIALVLSILLVSVVFLVTEWIPMEVVALLVLGSLALTGLTTPAEALSGFSNPAVITIWSVFILSGGLTRTGVGNIIGNRVLKMAGRHEMLLVVIIMVAAGVMSAFMNNVAVAALLLPVVMDIARNTGFPPSHLLLPLAYGSLLGGLITQIGTPPNILVSEALKEYGLPTFRLFDFTPLGLIVFAVGVAFMSLIGRRLLPAQNVVERSAVGEGVDLNKQYNLKERIFRMRVPHGSILAGKTLSESRIGTFLGLTVIGITRKDSSRLSPGSSEKMQSGDLLIVKGNLERLNEAKNWQHLVAEDEPIDLEDVFSGDVALAEVIVAKGSELSGKTLSELDFRNRLGAMVLAICHDGTVKRANLQDETLEAGDALLLQASSEVLEKISRVEGFESYRHVFRSNVAERYNLHEHLLVMRIPADSDLAGMSLKNSRLGQTLGVRVISIIRDDDGRVLPDPQEKLQAGDRLVVEGRGEDFNILHALNELEIDRRGSISMQSLLTEEVGLVETVLSPHAVITGKTLRQLNFREKYGLNVLAIWRRGQVYYTDLGNMALDFGDALLLYGPRDRLRVLGREPDFIVLTESAQEAPRLEKAKLAVLIMAATFVPVIMGWVPIYIATVVGAAVMILTRCLSMEDAYRYIEWKAVFLIAGMFPLGIALDQSGAARFLAEAVVSMVGSYGPHAVILALVSLTFFGTCFIPTAALVVLLAPIVLNTSAQVGMSPQSLMMAMAVAASASFMTPISHPANILVMGPGGYRFIDYLKIGGLLTLVVLAVIMVMLPIIWPLTPSMASIGNSQ
jgi:di/tricarboxylate transporter